MLNTARVKLWCPWRPVHPQLSAGMAAFAEVLMGLQTPKKVKAKRKKGRLCCR